MQYALLITEMSSFISYLLNSPDISIIEATVNLIDILIVKLEIKILPLFVRSGIPPYLKDIDNQNLTFPPKLT